MPRTLPLIDAALTIKPDAYAAVKEKWPAKIAERINALIAMAMDVIYVAAQHDHFEVPLDKLSINVWIESFSPKNKGRFCLLATTDSELFRLLREHKYMPPSSGVLLIPVSEILTEGGRDKDGKQRVYASVGVSSVIAHFAWPLTKGLTRLVSCDIIDPTQRPHMERLAKVAIHTFLTVHYHLAHRWPVWIANGPTGPVTVFGFNPVLDTVSSAYTLTGACRSRNNEGYHPGRIAGLAVQQKPADKDVQQSEG